MINKYVKFEFKRGTKLQEVIDELKNSDKDHFIQRDMVLADETDLKFIDKEEYNKIFNIRNKEK